MAKGTNWLAERIHCRRSGTASSTDGTQAGVRTRNQSQIRSRFHSRIQVGLVEVGSSSRRSPSPVSGILDAMSGNRKHAGSCWLGLSIDEFGHCLEEPSEAVVR